MLDEDKYFKIIKRRNTAGKGYYQVRFYDAQKTLIKSKSFPVGLNKPEVAKEAAEMLESIIPTHDERNALSYCVSFWAEDSEYFKYKAAKNHTLSESYRRNGEYMIKKAAPYLTGKKIGKITAGMLEVYEGELIESGVSVRTARAVIEAIVRPVNVYLRKMNMLELGKIEHGTSIVRERGTLTIEEIGKVVSYSGDQRARLIVLLGALCGLRLGEIRGLMIEDIDRVNKKIVVCHNVVFKSEGVDGVKQTKSKKSREVPLPGIVLEAIDVVQSGFPGKFVIPNMAKRKNPSDKSTFRRGFPRVLRAIGIDEAEQKRRNLVLHGLRHSYITLVQSIGINEFAAQYFAGHQDIKLTRHYTHHVDHINMEEAGDVINTAVNAVKPVVALELQSS